MEYEQVYQRLEEESLVVLEQFYRDVSAMYEARVKNAEQVSPEQHTSANSASTNNESEDNSEERTTAHSSYASSEEGANLVETATETDIMDVDESNELGGVENDSNHSAEVISVDESRDTTAEPGVKTSDSSYANMKEETEPEEEGVASRLRIRPTVKKNINRQYGVIVGAESLKKPPPRAPLAAQVAPKAPAAPAPATAPSTDRKSTHSRMKWTKQMLERLAKGVEMYRGDDWGRVAEYVGGSVTSKQCASRWSKGVSCTTPYKKKLRRRWSKAELTRLADLAKQHVIPSQWSESQKQMLPAKVDWFAIAQVLQRTPRTCFEKHCALQGKKDG